MASLTAPDISGLEGRFVVDQVVAAALLAGALLLILLGMRLVAWQSGRTPGVSSRSLTGSVPEGLVVINRRRWHLLVGLDNRASTSRAVALLWSVVVGYCLLTLVFVATARHSGAAPVPSGRIPVGWVNAAFQPLGTTYLVALGAPFAAALAARAIVGARVANGTLQKSTGATASVLDLVTGDSGDVDLVDLQYVLFNIITVLFVITQFVPHPSRGLVDIPPALAYLSGLSAALYTGNKLVASNPPQLTKVLTPSVGPGGRAMLAGLNLVVAPDAGASAAAQQTLVTLSHPEPALASPAAVPADGVTATQLTFTVPIDTPVGDGWDVSIRTNAGAVATLYGGLDVVPSAPVPSPAQSPTPNGASAHVGGIGITASL